MTNEMINYGFSFKKELPIFLLGLVTGGALVYAAMKVANKDENMLKAAQAAADEFLSSKKKSKW